VLTYATAPTRTDEPWDWGWAHRLCLAETRRFLGHTAAAEDAAQEAALRAWQRRLTCRLPDAPDPWLRQIARNEALRVLARPVACDLDDVPELQASGEDPVDARVIDVRGAIAGLGRDDQRLLMLRYWADLTQPQAAKVLEMPEGTVKVRLHRARNHLRTLLNEDLP
jgi:RNA polymerase sigma-70 factor (ECF subfamily)